MVYNQLYRFTEYHIKHQGEALDKIIVQWDGEVCVL